MNRFRLIAAAAGGDFERELKAIDKPIGKASTLAMRDVTAFTLSRGRGSILAAGFSNKWANALRSKTYENRGGDLINAVGFVWSKIGYAGIFQDGGTIKPAASRFLWIPIEDNLPPGRTWSPAKFQEDIGPLAFVERAGGGHPLLVGKVPVAKGGKVLAAPPRFASTLSSARKRSRFFVRSQAVTLPLFIGVSTVNETKKFEVIEAANDAMSHFGEFFARRLAASNG